MRDLKLDLTYNKEEGFYIHKNSSMYKGVILCGSILHKYFDIDRALPLTVQLSSKASAEAYKCKMINGAIHINHTDGKKDCHWIMDFTTDVIAALRPEILKKPFYVSILQ